MNKEEKIWLGKKEEFFKKKVFNLGAFLGGYVYLFYRKLYLLGIIVFIGYSICGYLKLYYVVGILNIGLGFSFNKLYLCIVRRRIENYRLRYMDEKIVKAKCKEKQVSELGLVIGIIITIGVIIIENVSWNMRSYEIEKMTFRLDKDWVEKDFSNDFYKKYELKSNEDCSLTVEAIGEMTNTEFLEEIAKSYDIELEIQDKVKNNLRYRVLKINNEVVEIEVLTIKNDNVLYALLLENDNKDNYCKQELDKFMETVKFRDQ